MSRGCNFAKLQSALDEIEGLIATVEAKDNELIQIRIELKEEKLKNAALEQKIKQLEEKKVLLSFEELKPGGILADYVKYFTFFPNYDCNDKFLDLINYADKYGEVFQSDT